jgi:predicted nuclease of predicted toxin-antitoxin system
MKLLFDRNIFYKLCELLRDIFPDAVHVRELGFEKNDNYIWEYAKEKSIVTKSSDFNDMAITMDFLPKIIWIKKATVQPRRLKNFIEIKNFAEDFQNSVLIIK